MNSLLPKGRQMSRHFLENRGSACCYFEEEHRNHKCLPSSSSPWAFTAEHHLVVSGVLAVAPSNPTALVLCWLCFAIAEVQLCCQCCFGREPGTRRAAVKNFSSLASPIQPSASMIPGCFCTIWNWSAANAFPEQSQRYTGCYRLCPLVWVFPRV